MLEVCIEKKLNEITLESEFTVENENLTILGASGCGKSMTLKCIAGIEQPDHGRIVLNERILFDSEKKINLSPQKRKIGYMFQDYALFSNMTVAENISMGMKKKKSEKKISQYIENFHLTGLENRMPKELSGGQKQRVALARMMAAEPEVILLDEPFSALDSYLKNQMLQEMKQELKSRGMPVIFVTHNRDEAFVLGDKICAMNHGKNEEAEYTKDFFQNPKTVNAAILSGCKNIATVERFTTQLWRVADWNLLFEEEDIPKGTCAIGIRAHDLVPYETIKSMQNTNSLSEKDEHECYGKYVHMENSEEKMSGIRVRRKDYRIEEALFEWNIYLRFEGANEEFLWRLSKRNSECEKEPQIPEEFFIKKEHILYLIN